MSAAILTASRSGVAALAALVLVRTCVAFQFQSVTLLVPVLRESFPVAAAQLGLLLGIYMAPGALVAIALPKLVQQIGRRNGVHVGLGLMAAGQSAFWAASSVEVGYLARLLAGAGGCIVYLATVDLAAQLQRAGQLAPRMGAIAAVGRLATPFHLC
jgi:fucose permease